MARLIIALLILVCQSPIYAEESFSLVLPGQQELDVRKYGDHGKSLIIWLASEYGPGSSDDYHAGALAKLGHEVWVPELHESYFLEPGQASLSSIPIEDIVALIEFATVNTQSQIVLMSSARGAQLALIAARQWQLNHPGDTRIQGALLMSAFLYEVSSEAGAHVDYMPIVNSTNLPVYLLDAQFSTTALRIQPLAEALGSGGSQVYTQILKGVQRRFHARQDAEMNPTDLRAKQNFAKTIDRAIKLLAITDVPEKAAASKLNTVQLPPVPRRNISLIKVANPTLAPDLQLPDFNGPSYSLSAQKGKLVLVNFWASWCPPCVEEIPSLHRLKSKVNNPRFEIVTVNIGEDPGRIGEFLQQVPIDFPVLMDIDGKASRQWNVHFYPSNYLVDQQGKISYIHQGALEWDSPENLEIVQKLLGP